MRDETKVSSTIDTAVCMEASAGGKEPKGRHLSVTITACPEHH